MMFRIIILFFAMFFISCSDYFSYFKYSDQERELYYNYKLLKAFYYKPERIKDFSEYEDMEVDSMYKDLKDYFCGAASTGSCTARYTRYYAPSVSGQTIINIEYSERAKHFGFKYSVVNDTLVVYTVYPISPARTAGLLKGDKLLLMNGDSLTGENAAKYKSDSAMADLAIFTVKRGDEIKTLPAMQKAEINDPTVYLDYLDDIPYITVTEFTVHTNNPNGTLAEFRAILREIQGAQSAIINLNTNPGGNIAHCTGMAAELIPSGKELLRDVVHKFSSSDGVPLVDTIRYFSEDYSDNKYLGKGTKWVIMQDWLSASCAERFVFALKYNRPETVIVGQTSYGKGIGQSYMRTYLEGLAYITSLQTYDPVGYSYHGIGIKPDIDVEYYNKEQFYKDQLEFAYSSAKNLRGQALKKSVITGENISFEPPPEYPIRKTAPGGAFYFQ